MPAAQTARLQPAGSPSKCPLRSEPVFGSVIQYPQLTLEDGYCKTVHSSFYYLSTTAMFMVHAEGTVISSIVVNMVLGLVYLRPTCQAEVPSPVCL